MSVLSGPNEQGLAGDGFLMQVKDASEIVFRHLRRTEEIKIKLSQSGGPTALTSRLPSSFFQHQSRSWDHNMWQTLNLARQGEAWAVWMLEKQSQPQEWKHQELMEQGNWEEGSQKISVARFFL